MPASRLLELSKEEAGFESLFQGLHYSNEENNILNVKLQYSHWTIVRILHGSRHPRMVEIKTRMRRVARVNGMKIPRGDWYWGVW